MAAWTADMKVGKRANWKAGLTAASTVGMKAALWEAKKAAPMVAC